MTLSPGIEPGPHWWEASALTTAPCLLSFMFVDENFSTLKEQFDLYGQYIMRVTVGVCGKKGITDISKLLKSY